MEVEATRTPGEEVEESLLDLADELRRAGFKLGVGEALRAQELLVRLAGRGRVPCDAATLRNYLAPIFCSKPAEQEQFYARFDDWLRRHPKASQLLLKHEDVVKKQQTPPPPPPAPLPGPSVSPLRLAALAAAVLLVVLATSVVAAYFTVPPNPTLSGIVVAADGGGPVAGAQVSFAEQKEQTGADGRFSLTYQAQPGSDDLVVSHKNFEVWRQSYATDDSAPSVLPVAIELDPLPTPEPRATPTPPPLPPPEVLVVTDDDRARFRQAVARINDFAAASRGAEQLSGWRRLYFLYYNWARVLAVALPLLLAGLWSAWSWYRRRLALRQRAALRLPEVDRILVRGAREEVFASERLRRTSQKYRAHGGVPSRELEGAATVLRTARQAGLFTPVYGRRQVRPEYLALVDRADFADHQAEYFDALLARLAAEGVHVSRYFFDGDPRLCFEARPDAAPLSLAELAAKHADDRVMVFSEGAGFVSEVTGRPKVLVEKFVPWEQKAFFTPRAARQWGARESSLAEWGFNVLYAGEDGLEAFIEAIQTGQAAAPAPAARRDAPFPPILSERPARWLGRRAPDETDGEVLLGQLRYFLGEAGFYWLAACAAYPALRWDVTVFLGHNLKLAGGRRLLEQETLLKLSRLPWFRHGRMPDWLRAQLLAGLGDEREPAVRETLELLLLSHLEHPTGGVPLDYAREDAEELTESRRRRLLRDYYQTLDEQSPLFDYVFLTFMSGRKPDPLELQLPDAVNRALARHRPRPFGLSPRGVVVAAALLAAAGWLLLTAFPPRVNYVPLIPTFTLFESDAPETDMARSAEPLSTYYTNLRNYREQAFVTLLEGDFFGRGTVKLANLDQETVDAYALRPTVYITWLQDTLRRDAPDLDPTAYQLTALPVEDAEQWRTRLLFIDAVATGTPGPTPTPPAQPTPATQQTPATQRTPAMQRTPPRRGTLPTPANPNGGRGGTRDLLVVSLGTPEAAVLSALAQVSDVIEISVTASTFQVYPSNTYELTMRDLQVGDAIPIFEKELQERLSQLSDADLLGLNITQFTTVGMVVSRVNAALGGRTLNSGVRVYILYDEANKATAQAAEQELRGAGFRDVQSFVAYTLSRPQGGATFRPQYTPSQSVVYCNIGSIAAAGLIRGQLLKIAPGLRLGPHIWEAQTDADFNAFVVNNRVDVQVSLLSPDAWRGTYGAGSTVVTMKDLLDAAEDALKRQLMNDIPQAVGKAGQNWDSLALSDYYGDNEEATDTALIAAANYLFQRTGTRPTPGLYTEIAETIDRQMTVREAYRRLAAVLVPKR